MLVDVVLFLKLKAPGIAIIMIIFFLIFKNVSDIKNGFLIGMPHAPQRV